MLQAVQRAWLSLGEPPPGLVAAVSGGPDSVALLRALIEVRGDRPIPLVIAHLNHQLRGAQSNDDEAFVVDLHAQLLRFGPLELVHERIDLPRLAAAEGGNIEALARRERYRWLAAAATRFNLHHVATGHTSNDQAETVLHRLMRGAGLAGLRGIAFRRPLAPAAEERREPAPERRSGPVMAESSKQSGAAEERRELYRVEVVRPLLHVTREQVVAWLGEKGQAARHDSSNDDRRFTRNRIRHELLPLLARDYNPRIVSVLSRLADQAEETVADQEQEAAELLRRAEKPRAGLVVLDVESLRQSSARLVRAALRRIWQREGWSMGEMGFAHWRRLADLVVAESGGCDLPGGVHARRREGVLQLRCVFDQGGGSGQVEPGA